MADRNRIGFLAAARVIGMLLVIIGHSYPFDVYISPALWKIKDFIYTFHMPLFLFLSGYLLTFNKRPAGAYIRRRSVRLLVPYFSLSVLAFVPKVLMQRFLNDSVDFSVWYLIKSQLVPRANVWGHFWYIPVVFVLCCVGVLLLKPMRKHPALGWAVLGGTWLLLFLPRATDWFALEDLRKTAFYFVLGMMSALWDPQVRMASNRCWLLAFPLAVVLFRTVDTILTDSVIGCLMIGFVLHVGMLVPLHKFNLFAAIEKNSFTIFLLSWPAQAVAEVVCNKLLHFPVLLTMGVMLVAGITVPLVCAKIVSLIDRRLPMKWIKLAIGM